MQSSLADVLSRVWQEQGQSGFLLTDPAQGGNEVRELDDPVSRVRFRFRWLPHRELRTDVGALEARGILDPERDESALFRDSRDASGRFCFLCPANIRECNPMEELVPIHLAGREYYAGANFAWISREHFTVLSAEHTDQVFSRHSLAAMLDLHAQAGGRFRVVYNAPHAGATIPWHLHYQVTSDVFPVEGLPAGGEATYPTLVRRYSGATGGDEAHEYVTAWVDQDADHHRVNVLVSGPVVSPTVSVFARDTRRSHAAQKGLMGGFEVCGDFIYSEPDKRGMFESASAELARSLLSEIRPQET